MTPSVPWSSYLDLSPSLQPGVRYLVLSPASVNYLLPWWDFEDDHKTERVSHQSVDQSVQHWSIPGEGLTHSSSVHCEGSQHWPADLTEVGWCLVLGEEGPVRLCSGSPAHTQTERKAGGAWCGGHNQPPVGGGGRREERKASWRLQTCTRQLRQSAAHFT